MLFKNKCKLLTYTRAVVFCPIFTEITGESDFLVFNDNDVYHGN